MREPIGSSAGLRGQLALVLGVDLALIVIAILRGETPDEFFLEGNFLTAVSFAQLQVLFGLAVYVGSLRQHDGSPSRSGAWLWLLMAVGFSFLSLDETLRIHETIDERIHGWFDIKETGLTDRLDDLIVGLYGFCALLVLGYFRGEIVRFRAALPLLSVGFAGFGIGVALDLLGNRSDGLAALAGSDEIGTHLQTWVNVAEESSKLLTEGVFIVALVRCAEIARGEAEPPAP